MAKGFQAVVKILFSIILLLNTAIAAYGAVCKEEDFVAKVSGYSECLLMRRYGSTNPTSMVVWLHGNISSGGPANYHFPIAQKFALDFTSENIMSVALVRPGYPDGNGEYSSGSDNGRADNWPRTVLVSSVLNDFTDEIIDLYHALKKEKESFADLGIDFEEKAFYDILKALAHKYQFEYPEDKLIELSRKVKEVVDDKARYTDWNQRVDIKAELKADLIILLAESGYPPVDRDEVYKEIFEQAENFKKNRSV
jgi:hypothetical protein